MSEEYKQFVTQQDEKCRRCGTELPTGSSCYTTDEEIFCLDCIGSLEIYKEALEDNIW